MLIEPSPTDLDFHGPVNQIVSNTPSMAKLVPRLMEEKSCGMERVTSSADVRPEMAMSSAVMKSTRAVGSPTLRRVPNDRHFLHQRLVVRFRRLRRVRVMRRDVEREKRHGKRRPK